MMELTFCDLISMVHILIYLLIFLWKYMLHADEEKMTCKRIEKNIKSERN